MEAVRVNNEVGRLKSVLVHRPGPETRRFPHGEFALAFPLRAVGGDFDLARAQDEHDALTAILRAEGVEVIELVDLVEEALAFAPGAKDELIGRFLANCRIEGAELTEAATRYLSESAGTEQFVARLFNGIRYDDTDLGTSDRFPLAALTDSAFDPDTFLSAPLNTAFFTRDPLSVIGGGVSLNRMYWHDRNREIDLLQTVVKHHPRFAGTPQWFDHDSSFHLEGGDIVNLSGHAVAIGLSSRTESLAIDRLGEGLLWDDGSSITDVYVIEVPQSGNRLHLDAYLSPISGDTFVVDPLLAREARAYHLRRARRRGSVHAEVCNEGLARILGAATGGDPVRLIDFGDSANGPVAFEYGNGAAGILPLAPGNLCVCAENLAANEALVEAGMTVHPVSIQEMAAGFGGPNSLCLPLMREDL